MTRATEVRATLDFFAGDFFRAMGSLLFFPVLLEDHRLVADRDEVAVGEIRGHDLRAVDEGAVLALEILDLVESGPLPDLAVAARQVPVLEHEVAILSPTDH